MMLMPCKVERIVAEKSVKSAKSGSKKSSKFYFIKWVRFVQRETIKTVIINDIMGNLLIFMFLIILQLGHSDNANTWEPEQHVSDQVVFTPPRFLCISDAFCSSSWSGTKFKGRTDKLQSTSHPENTNFVQ